MARTRENLLSDYIWDVNVPQNAVPIGPSVQHITYIGILHIIITTIEVFGSGLPTIIKDNSID